MNMTVLLKRHLRWLNLPTLSLLAFLQRTPVLQIATTVEEFVLRSPMGTVLKSAAALAASLGAINSMAGASTTLTVTGSGGTVDASGASLTVGTAAQIAFSIPGSSGWSDPAGSWTATGIPAGLTLDGTTATGKITGSPTTASSGNATLVVHSVSGGFQQSYTYMFTVTGASTGMPTITTQPQSQTVSVGANVTFTVAASGTPAPTFQWEKDTVAIMGETGTSLMLTSVQTTAAGTYTVVATNSAGSVTSTGAVLAVTSPTGAPSTPASAGGFASSATEVTLSWLAAASGNAASGYKVERATDSSFGSGLTSFNLSTASTSYVDATASANTTYFYRISAVNAAGASAPTSAIQVVTLASNRTGATAFANIATRAFCGTGNSVTIGGFVVSGSAPKRVLVRAVGPSLTNQGIGQSEVLLDPMIEVHQGSPVIASNDNWGDNTNAAEIASTAAQIGASAFLSTDSKSSAVLLSLNPGVYSFVASGKGGTSGVVLLEVYDADTSGGGSHFANIATRAFSTTGNGVTIGGFVVAGAAPKQVLMRAVGPTLTKQGIGQTEVLVDPTIELHQGSPIIAINDNWGDNANSAAIMSTGARIGATPFDVADTASSALLLKLPPGVYSFIARGKADAPGIVLVEVYDAD
jgi:hypothetical protein